MNRLIPVLAGLLGVGLTGNGIFMLASPETWYFAVPGVTSTGPFNQHFLRDIGLIFVLEKSFLAVVSVPVATAFYLFEVVIVISIQAFIFAALSAIYIGSAIEPEH